jgi:hypothetical protein
MRNWDESNGSCGERRSFRDAPIFGRSNLESRAIEWLIRNGCVVSVWTWPLRRRALQVRAFLHRKPEGSIRHM